MGIPRGKLISVDTETTGLSTWLGDRPYCFTFCNEKGETGYFLWSVNPYTRQLYAKDIMSSDWTTMNAFFLDESITKIFHNAKFDLRMLESIGIKSSGRIEDTYIAAHCLRSNEELGLKPLAKKYLEFPDNDEKELRSATVKARHEAKNKGWKLAEKQKGLPEPIPADYWMAPKELILKYACGDVERTMLLWKLLYAQLIADPACMKIYEREMLISKIVYGWETRGMRLNELNTNQNIVKCYNIMDKAKEKLDTFMGYDFNPDSVKHARDLIYNKLGYDVKYLSKKTNMPAVNLKALTEMDHPMVKTIRDWDGAKNLISMFETFKHHAVNEVSGHKVVHFNINPVGTATGRFATRNPNIMSASGNTRGTSTIIDIVTRSAFSPRFGYSMYCLDYIAQEIWILANGSQDKTMLKVLLSGGDIHHETALAIWGQKALR